MKKQSCLPETSGIHIKCIQMLEFGCWLYQVTMVYHVFCTVYYIYTQYDIYQDPPMIHLFVYRFYFARAEDFRSFAKNCSFAENMLEGSFLPHCQLVLLQFLNLRFFALSWRIFAFFLRKFSLELVSHQSKQVLFSVELG